MEGLDDLLKLLTRVKKNGWDNAFPEDLYDNHSKDTKRNPTSSWHLSTFLNTIEEGRVCIKALDEARRRLGKRLRCLRRLSKPLVLEDGIKCLPDDVLAIVFEMTRHFIDDGPNQSAVCLSHVSRRFRRVALATPLLWTTIRDCFGENQIREFISRSGRLDLDVEMRRGLRTESFLKLAKETSHRWSSFDIFDADTEDFMMELGITDLPRLRYLTYTRMVELSTFNMPRLSQVEGWGWLLPVGSWFLSQLTHVEFHISGEDDVTEDLATALYDMKNLQDLSFKLQHCTDQDFAPSDRPTYLKPHSVRIDRLAISILGEMQHCSARLFMALMHLRPLTVELSINSIFAPETFLVSSEGELFPYGSTIKLHTPQSMDVMTILVKLLRSCDIVKTIHFDTPMAKGPFQWRQQQQDGADWKRVRSLDHLRFMNCDGFAESDVEVLVTRLLQTEVENGLQSLEIISCKLISDDFLLGLHDEVGDRLKWTL